MGMTEGQIDKMKANLGIIEAQRDMDAVGILHEYGPDIDVEGRALAPADQVQVGDLVAIYATQRFRIARVWATTKGKVSAYYVTPSAYNDAVKHGNRPNVMSVTDSRTDAFLFLSAANAIALLGSEEDTPAEPEPQTYVEPSTLQQWQSAAADDSDEAQVLPFPVPSVADQIDEGSEQTGDDEMDDAISLPATEDYTPAVDETVPEIPAKWAPETLALPTRTMSVLKDVQSGKYGPRAAHIAEEIASEGIDKGQRATRIVGHLRMALYAANEMRAGDALQLVPEPVETDEPVSA